MEWTGSGDDQSRKEADGRLANEREAETARIGGENAAGAALVETMSGGASRETANAWSAAALASSVVELDDVKVSVRSC